MATIESHAPWLNFVDVTTTSTTPVVIAPIALITIERRHPGCASAPLCFSLSQCRTMPVCDSVNDVNTPTTYSWISRVRFASNATIITHARAARTDHAVREHEPVAAVHELAGHEPVPREDRREPREVLVGGVRRQDQDRGREERQHVEAEPAAEHRVGDLRDHGALVAHRDVPDVGREARDPEEHRDRDHAHDRQGLGGVLGLRPPERRHPVRDRLDARERRRARRERMQDHEQRDRLHGARHLGRRRDGLARRASADAAARSRGRS